MKSFAVVLVVALLASALFWMCPLVLANLTLTIACRPGGSVIVSSSAINNGDSFTVGPGEEYSWSVPSGAVVTLRAADFAPYLDFRGWDGPFWEWVPGGPGTYDNPVTITVWSSSKVTGFFADPGAINNIRVVLGSLRRIAADSLEIVFTVENDRAPYTVMQEIYGVRLYCDGEPMEGVGFSEVAVDPGCRHRFTAVLPLSRLGDGNHSFFVVANAVFYTPHPHPADPASLADGSGVSDIVHFVVDTAPPSVPEPSPSEEPSNSEPLLTGPLFSAAVIVSAAAVSFGLVAYSLRRKKKGAFK